MYKPHLTAAEMSDESEIKPDSSSDLPVDAFLLLDDNLNLLSINDVGQKLFDVSAEAALGKCIMDVMPNIKKSAIYNKYRHILKTGEPLVIHQKLGDRSLAVQVFKLGDSLGIIVSDITERKRAEEALKLASAYNRSLIEASLDPLVTIGADGKITNVNATTEAETGYTRERLIGTDFCDYFTEPEKARAGYQQVLRDGKVFDYALDLRHRNGHVTSVLYNASVYRDEAGRVIGVFAAARGITERKRAEEALKESEKHYSALVKNLTDAVLIFKGRVITWCNDKVEEIYGYPKEELLGKRARFFYPNDINPSEFTRILSSALKERGLFNGTTRFQRKNGSIVDIEYSLLQISGKAPIEIIAVARDITERKLVEREGERLLAELVEKTKELEQIIYVTSHDLRSPLVNIQGFTRELDESFKQVYEIFDSKAVPSAVKKKLAPLLDEDIPHALQYILASSSKMNSLLSGLLRLSRLGRAALKIKRLGMNKLMAEVVASFEFQVKESGVKIRVEELPPCYGDETQINQVFSNLLDNALKFLDPDRPGMIRISGKAEKGRVTYCVEDNGIGIADKDREQIFEIFRRLDPDAGIGEGLGLTIVRKILDRHSGKVWVESEPGKGSRFFVSLQTKGGINDKK